ncbi:MAG: hypothetical protein NVS3B19_20490 [Ginsengibacter sp.]
MEVHKHPHHVTHAKKWEEYLLEFLMIFLAVTLGFFAENIREHFAEKRNANQYLNAYHNDLIQNQLTIKRYDSTYLSLLPVYDSICNIYFTKTENLNLIALERLLIIGKRNILTQISSPTYTQLLNSGSLKYIGNISIRNSMSDYYEKLNALRDYDLRIALLKNATYSEVMKIEDMHAFWGIDKKNPDNIRTIPGMQPFDSITGRERRSIISYYRTYFVELRANHNSLKELMESNKALVTLIDKELNK